MAESDFSTLSPYELGCTASERAIPYLIRYLYCGDSQDRRLAASAIAKLAAQHPDACAFAVVALLDCLEDPAPQTRQYALNTLKLFSLPPEAQELLQQIVDTDDKPYNRDAAARLLVQSPLHIVNPQAIGPVTPHQSISQIPTVDAGSTQQAPIDRGGRAALETINRFLEVVYRVPCRVSDLLTRGGLDTEALSTLRQQHLDTFLRLLQQHLCAWIQTLAPPRTTYVCIRRFELDGHPPQTLAELGDVYGVSRERIRQIEVKMLSRVRHQRPALERLAVDTACTVLGLPPLTIPPALHSESTARKSKVHRNAGVSAKETWALFETGLSLMQIAEQRGLVQSTILGHLAEGIESGRLTVTQVISPDDITLVRSIIEGDDPPVSYAELLHRLPETITYGHLRCITAAFPELIPEHPELTLEQQDIAKVTICAMVVELSGQLPRSGLVKLLVRSTSERIAAYREHPAYGALTEYYPRAVLRLIDELIAAGVIALDDHRRLCAAQNNSAAPLSQHKYTIRDNMLS